MNRYEICRAIAVLALAALFAGCAQRPTEEIEKAEQALQEAKAAQAGEWAPDALAEAEAKMEEANQLVDQGDYSEAVPVLQETARLADEARRKAAQAKREAEEEEKRRKAEEERKAREQEAALPGSHTVEKGEYLWKIAGYEQIYGDPYQWPRIYNANRDKIDDPDLIYPGQVFDIPR